MMGGADWWEALVGDLRMVFRRLRRAPGVVLGVTLTLSLGIGANAAIFGILDQLFLRPPAHVARPDEVRRVMREGEWLGRRAATPVLTYPDIVDLATIPEFASVGGFTGVGRYTMGEGLDATEVRGVQVTAGFFRTLGVRPRLGRFFGEDDDRVGAPPTVVLSAAFWERALGGDPSVLGRSVELAGTRFSVIGVAPDGFTGVGLLPVDVWLPGVTTQMLLDHQDVTALRQYWWLRAVVRLPAGVSAEAAEARATSVHLSARADQIDRGQYDGKARLYLESLSAVRGSGAAGTASIALWLAGVSLCVLLVACANVANLLLVQAIHRRRDRAIHLALGTSGRRLVRRTMLEASALAGFGGLGALAVAEWGGQALRSVLAPGFVWMSPGVDWRVLVASLGMAVAVGLLVGWGPAVQSTRDDFRRDLWEGGGGSTLPQSRLRSGLTITQATFSVVLLVGSGLFVRSLHEVRRVDLGIDTEGLVVATLELKREEPDEAEIDRVYGMAMARMRGLPAVTAVAATDVPFQAAAARAIELPGLDALPLPPGTRAFYFSVTPDYHETVGLRIVRGRPLRPGDVAEAPRVAVVSQALAQAFWPNAEPLGRCFYFDGGNECTTVVGVSENESMGELGEPQALTYYLPIAQTGFKPGALYARGAGDADELAAVISPILRSLSPEVRSAAVVTVNDLLAPQRRPWTLGAALFSAFGVLALLVASVGLYSLLAFEVVQSSREFGIRSALGANRGRLLLRTMVRGVRLAAVGIFGGLVLCVLLSPLVEPMLFRVSGRDPWVMGLVGGGVLLVSAAASLVPALRAIRADPIQALRSD